MIPDRIPDDTPYLGIFRQIHRRVSRVLGFQPPPPAMSAHQTLNSKFAENGCDDDVTWLRDNTTVDDKQIAVENPSTCHGMPTGAQKVCCRGPIYQRIQIKAAFGEVVSRGGESGSDTTGQHWNVDGYPG